MIVVNHRDFWHIRFIIYIPLPFLRFCVCSWLLRLKRLRLFVLHIMWWTISWRRPLIFHRWCYWFWTSNLLVEKMRHLSSILGRLNEAGFFSEDIPLVSLIGLCTIVEQSISVSRRGVDLSVGKHSVQWFLYRYYLVNCDNRRIRTWIVFFDINGIISWKRRCLSSKSHTVFIRGT